MCVDLLFNDKMWNQDQQNYHTNSDLTTHSTQYRSYQCQTKIRHIIWNSEDHNEKRLEDLITHLTSQSNPLVGFLRLAEDNSGEGIINRGQSHTNNQRC